MNERAQFFNEWRVLSVRLLGSILIPLFTIAYSPPLQAVDCNGIPIGLSSQADVDSFQTDYGPCDRVVTLYIEGPDINNLDGLSGLTSTGSSLYIQNNPALNNLDGLSSLVSVGRNLRIENNDGLTNLGGLTALTNVSNAMIIIYNDALEYVSGLSALTSVGASLVIWGNSSLINIDGLSTLTSIAEAQYADQRSLHIEGNNALLNLDGLSSVTTIGAPGGSYTYVIIDNNAALTSLGGLSSVTTIWGDLVIDNNASLLNLDGLTGITRGFDVTISNNASLVNVAGLSALSNVSTLIIDSNVALANMDGLSKLTGIGRSLSIQNNRVLSNLDGLSSLTYVGNDLYVQSNTKLDQCSGLSRLVDEWDDRDPGPGTGQVPDVGNNVYIGGNFPGCNSIQEILVTGVVSRINSGLNDAWYNPLTDGQGFFITVFPDLKSVSLAWFTYDTELPAEDEDAPANLGDAGNRWLTAVGPIEGNQVVMDIEMTSGGLFDTATEIQRTDPPGSDGTILLTFNSCNSGTVEYDIPSINSQGMVPIRRVVDDNIALCEALNAFNTAP
jgi:hypothetical protein